MQQSIYESENEVICLQQDCPEKGKRVSNYYCTYKKHRTVTKHQVLKRVKSFRANYQTDFKIKENLSSKLDMIYQNVTQIIKEFNDVMEQIQNQLYRYIKLVKSSYQSDSYFQADHQVCLNFDYKTVTSALEKAEKYQKIQFPYAQYPLERIEKFNFVFDQTYKITKTDIISAIENFKQKMQELQYTDFLRVKASEQLRFSKFLKNKVYQISQDCLSIKRKSFEQQKLNSQQSLNRSVFGTQISAIALVQKMINPQNPQITFRIKKFAKSNNILIGVIKKELAQQMEFSNCNNKGYWFSNFGKLLIKHKQQKQVQFPRYKDINWSIEQGEQITMRLIKNELTFIKNGTFFPYTAQLKLRHEDIVNIYPVIQIGQGTQIQIVSKL